MSFQSYKAPLATVIFARRHDGISGVLARKFLHSPARFRAQSHGTHLKLPSKVKGAQLRFPDSREGLSTEMHCSYRHIALKTSQSRGDLYDC